MLELFKLSNPACRGRSNSN